MTCSFSADAGNCGVQSMVPQLKAESRKQRSSSKSSLKLIFLRASDMFFGKPFQPGRLKMKIGCTNPCSVFVLTNPSSHR